MEHFQKISIHDILHNYLANKVYFPTGVADYVTLKSLGTLCTLAWFSCPGRLDDILYSVCCTLCMSPKHFIQKYVFFVFF